MCLNVVDTKKTKDEFKDTVPEEGLIVYKVVEVKNKRYYPVFQCSHTPYEIGIAQAKTEMELYATYTSYKAGFHFWLTREAAEKLLKRKVKIYKEDDYVIIECVVKKEWITTIGTQSIEIKEEKAIVANQAIFPKYK